MRDPKRIDRILGKLWLLWREAPDLRLGQLLVNVAFDEQTGARKPTEMEMAGYDPSHFCHDPYNIEDDNFERALDAYIRRLTDKENNV